MNLRTKIILPIVIITIIQVVAYGITVPFLITLGSRVTYISRYYLFRVEVKKTIVAEIVAIALSILIPLALAKMPNILALLIWIIFSVIVILIEYWTMDNITFIEEDSIDENNRN